MHYCDTALIIRVVPKLDSIELNADLLPEHQSSESGELDTIDLIADYIQRVLGA